MDRIEIDKKIMHGKPVIKGTRVPIEIIVGSLAGGMSFEDVEKEYGITREDILACLNYAARIVTTERVYSLPAM